ncbi:uncharacterized protein N7484_008065 [Penicillium longicatenatum]|uniref:uncharacterized protein n=1 Tax=Penicillium longicatenatum TaxID=1561947 RepID=UPI00254792DB|nr:uncharacterized protein N7484_008065 [Penicillium longicatenatum]KAJ5640203.1 hypothetical protein N7484_008065 [Penicillium longicatenatum]
MRFSTTVARPLQLVLRTMQWCSAVIVLGLTSWFISRGPRGQHIIYQEVIAAFSIVCFIPAFISPFRPSFLNKMVMLIDLVFSYLWLTAFVFAAEDYDWHSCYLNSPPGVSCRRKRANQAFIFLAFIFTFFGLFLEYAAHRAYQKSRPTQPVVEKTDAAGTRPPLDAPAEVAAPTATV